MKRLHNNTAADIATHVGQSFLATGVYLNWGWGWGLIAYGGLMVVSAQYSLKWHTLRSAQKWLEQRSQN